jgi:hypothetical protein
VDDDHCFVGFDGYQKVIDSVDVVLIACASKFHPAVSHNILEFCARVPARGSELGSGSDSESGVGKETGACSVELAVLL